MTPEAAQHLAERLSSGELRWPVVVVTIAGGQSEPYVPVDDVAREVDGLAEVILLPTGAASWVFSQSLPPMTQVFGGASRVYSTDRSWLSDPYRSVLRFAHNTTQGARVADELAADVFGLAQAQTRPVTVATIQAHGEVMGTLASRALVRLENGATAAIWAELTVPGVPIERLVRKGQRVEGGLDAALMRLDVRGLLPAPGSDVIPPAAVLTHVLGRVEAVRADAVVVALLPGHEVTVPAAWAADDPLLGYVAGDVVVATWFEDDDELRLRLDLWDGEEPVEAAPSILPGGPPWLEVPELRASDSAVEPTDEAAGPVEDDVDPTNPLTPELLSLRSLANAQRTEVERLRSEVKELRRRGQVGRRRRGSSEDVELPLGRAFLDDDEQLRFEVHVAWARRVSPGEKAATPLRRYELGPRFLDSLEELEGVSRAKVVDVVMEVVTGLDHKVVGRDLHQLRTSAGGSAPAVVRADGSTCWRAALQRETASARRLHYWALPDGSIELSRVVKHDDMEP